MNKTYARSGLRSDRQPRMSRQEITEEVISQQGRLPEVRISRNIIFDAPSTDTLRHFVDDIGSRNRFSGEAQAVGSMALTLVSAQAMSRMLAKKYPRPYQSRKGVLQVVRGLAKEYNQFVGRDEEARSQIAAEQAGARNLIDPATCKVILPEQSGDTGQCIVMPTQPKPENEFDGIFIHDLDDEPEYLDSDLPAFYGDPQKRRWNAADFPVANRLKNYGESRLGFNLTDVDQLHEEFDATEEYLRKVARLDTKLMMPPRNNQFRFEPHVSVFRSFLPAAQVSLSYVATFPETIALESPEAYTSPGHMFRQ